MRFSISAAVLLAATSALAQEPAPAGSNPAHGPRHPFPMGQARGPGGEPIGAQGVRPSGSGMPGNFQDRMEKLRERQAEMRERHERARQLDDEIHADLKKKDVDVTALRAKLDEYKNLRRDRQRDQRLALHRRYRMALGLPPVKAELELHARRSARLFRMETLIATERKGPEREKLLARVSALREQENQRHEREMDKLAPQPMASASAAVPVPPPAPAPSGGAQ